MFLAAQKNVVCSHKKMYVALIDQMYCQCVSGTKAQGFPMSANNFIEGVSSLP